MQPNCLICQLNTSKKFVVEESEFWQIDNPANFDFPGLFFIKTKRHIESLDDLSPEEAREIGSFIKKYAKKSKNISHAERVLAMSLGLSEPHIHFWILPKTLENGEQVMEISKAIKKLVGRNKS